MLTRAAAVSRAAQALGFFPEHPVAPIDRRLSIAVACRVRIVVPITVAPSWTCLPKFAELANECARLAGFDTYVRVRAGRLLICFHYRPSNFILWKEVLHDDAADSGTNPV